MTGRIGYRQGFVLSSEDSAFTAAVDDMAYFCSTPTGSYAADLPPAAGNAGIRHLYKATSITENRTITITADGSDEVEGAATLVLYVTGDMVELTCDGTGWWVTQQYLAPHYSKMVKTDSQTYTGGNQLIKCNLIEKQNVGLADIVPVSASHHKVLRAGWYDVDYSASLNNLDAGKHQSPAVWVQSTQTDYGRHWSSIANSETPNAFSTHLFLNKNDVVELYISAGQSSLVLDTTLPGRASLSITEVR